MEIQDLIFVFKKIYKVFRSNFTNKILFWIQEFFCKSRYIYNTLRKNTIILDLNNSNFIHYSKLNWLPTGFSWKILTRDFYQVSPQVFDQPLYQYYVYNRNVTKKIARTIITSNITNSENIKKKKIILPQIFKCRYASTCNRSLYRLKLNQSHLNLINNH